MKIIKDILFGITAVGICYAILGLPTRYAIDIIAKDIPENISAYHYKKELCKKAMKKYEQKIKENFKNLKEFAKKFTKIADIKSEIEYCSEFPISICYNLHSAIDGPYSGLIFRMYNSKIASVNYLKCIAKIEELINRTPLIKTIETITANKRGIDFLMRYYHPGHASIEIRKNTSMLSDRYKQFAKTIGSIDHIINLYLKGEKK